MTERLASALAYGNTLERVLRVLPVAAPAAGAQFSIVVPGGEVWIVRSVVAKLVTSGVAGTRSVALTVDDQTNVLMAAAGAATQAATLTQTYAWATQYGASPSAAGGGFASAALPELPLPSGYTIRSVAAAFDVGDQWSSIVVAAEAILSQPMGVHEKREAIELYERLITSDAAQGGL